MKNLQDTAAKPGTMAPDRESDGIATQAKETLRSAATTATRVARAAYDQGEDLVRDARERYPDAERYYRSGTETLRHYAGQPVIALLVGIGLGVAFYRLADHWSERQSEQVPDYARTR
jgi:hypothetical protein